MAILLSTSFNSAPIGDYTEPNSYWIPSVSSGASSATAIRQVNDTTHTGGGRGLQISLIGDGTTGVYRSELTGDGASSQSPAGSNRGWNTGDERWIGFSFMCGKNNELTTLADPEIIWQCHISQAPGGAVNPPLALEVEGNALFLSHRYNTTSDDNTLLAMRAQVGTIFPGVWNSVVFRLVLQHSIPGVTKMWKDGRVVYNNDTLPNHYNRGSSGTRYVKFGCYAPGWSSTPPAANSARARRDWSFDQIKIGDAASSYSEVAPVFGIVSPTRPRSEIL